MQVYLNSKVHIGINGRRAEAEENQEELKYYEINADAKNYMKILKLEGKSFQVDSQFNALEMASAYITPEHGITIYKDDFTQGTVCAMACPYGTLYRNYFGKYHYPQTENNQINTLDYQNIY